MPTPSTASLYFDKLNGVENLFEYLCRYAEPDSGRSEKDWLEFKGCKTWDKKAGIFVAIADKQVKEYWSQALSGFGNTEGGVLIWGLDAYKDAETQKDCVHGLALHEDAERLADRLTELYPSAVEPPLFGVKIKAILKPNSKEGFVVCLIPEGTVKPYRGESADRNYYIRAGTSFVVPSISLLRSLFYPKASAYLVPSIIVEPASANTQVKLHFCLDNQGTLSARNVSLIISTSHIGSFDRYASDQILPPPHYKDNIPITFVRPINPRLHAHCFYTFAFGSPAMLYDGIRIAVTVSCEDMQLSYWTRLIAFEEITKPGRIKFECEFDEPTERPAALPT